MGAVNAAEVVAALEERRTASELATVRTRLAPDEPAVGMRMRDLFDTAKAHQDLPLDEVDRLLDHPAYEPRMAAWCILDFQVRRRIDDEARRDRYELYRRRHDRITTWDMVDRAAPRVVGGFLAGKDPAPLFELAASPGALERRTAITAPLLYTRAESAADLATGFAVAALLATDPEPVVHNAVGTFLKHAGERDRDALLAFLHQHAATMPRPAVRLAVAKLAPPDRARFG
jgi:3-methyladenine DNA glycosylase AlkD